MGNDIIKLKGGTTTQRLATTPAQREVVIDQTTGELFYGDGSTAGGQAAKVNLENLVGVGAAFSAFAQAETAAEQAALLKVLHAYPDISFFQHSLSYTDWRKAAKFTYTKTTAPTIVPVSVGNGATHVKLLRWDGAWSAVKAISGITTVTDADWGTAPVSPYNTLLPKFVAVVPCNSGGTITGDLTSFSAINNQLTSFSGTGLSALTYLNLGSNQLTSFSGTGLSALSTLELGSNQLTSFSGTGLSALSTLNLSNNQLTSFSGTGLSALSIFNLSNNQLTSALNIVMRTSGLPPAMMQEAVDIRNNAMSSSAVDAMFNTSMFPNQSAKIDVSGGTNGTPTSASAAARAAMSLWTIVTN